MGFSGGGSGGGGSSPVDSVFGRIGAVVADPGDYTVAQVTGAAPLASPALTGTPTVPTAAALTDDTQAASTAYTDSAVNVEKTRATGAEALLAPLASPALSGVPTAPTPATADNSTKIATTAYVKAQGGAPTSWTILGPPYLGLPAADENATANELYLQEILVPAAVTLTGITGVISVNSGVRHVIVSLYNAAGNLVASSASTVIASTSGNELQQVPFSAAYNAAAGTYFIGIQFDNTSGNAQFIGSNCASPCSMTAEASFAAPASVAPPSAPLVATPMPMLSTY